jgi:hypothetical protein
MHNECLEVPLNEPSHIEGRLGSGERNLIKKDALFIMRFLSTKSAAQRTMNV